MFLLAATMAQGATYFVTVAGLGGEADYEQRFAGWAQELDKVVKGAPDVEAETLFGPAATKAKLKTVLAGIAARASAEDAVVLVLIGHGTFDGVDYKMNLPGPDITARELDNLLDGIRCERQLVVNATSASGGSVAPLMKPNRVIIAATKSGTQRNATVFARYWVEALRDPASDTDKNEAITALEAFKYAEAKTAKFYETQKRLATEHPVIEDTGRGDPVRTPSPENGKGINAARLTVVRMGSAQQAALDPAKRQLLTKKEDLEQKIDKLKYEKAAMPTEEYKRQLSVLLLELAKTQAELDK
jgi:hypothetical protein